MKRLCIFDFDGTLFDSITDVVKCFNQTFQELGYPTQDMEFYRKSLGGNIDVIISTILKDDDTPENREKVKNTYGKIYLNDDKENTHPFDGIVELLERLQEENYLLAINSNRNTFSVKEFLYKFAPNINFIDIQGHIDSKPSKPDPYGVNMILKKANVEREECVYIGDSEFDVQTARNARIDCILVSWGYGAVDVYENSYPKQIANSAEEIFDIIKVL